MFEFSHWVVIGIVALIVFGPEDLPKVARTVGHLLGKFRRYVADVKTEIAQEMEAADMRRIYEDVQSSARSLQDSVQAQVQSLSTELNTSVQEIRQELNGPEAPAAGEPAGTVQDTLPAPETPMPGAPADPDEPVPERDTHTLDMFEMPPAAPESAPSVAKADDEPQLDLFGMPVEPVQPSTKG